MQSVFIFLAGGGKSGNKPVTRNRRDPSIRYRKRVAIGQYAPPVGHPVEAKKEINTCVK